jgi:transposase-like protein
MPCCDFDRAVASAKQTRATGCADCHMPKRRTEDVVHAMATDHYIQRRPPEGEELAEMAEQHETGNNICQGGRYLYRALDSSGATIDFWFSAERDAAAAKQFFQKALLAPGQSRPRVITVDGNLSYPKVIAELKKERKLGCRCHCRTCPYLNNVVEQDHRAIKRRVNPAKETMRSG